jgi:hypothetical protein
VRLIGIVGRVALRVLKLAMYTIWGAAGFCILYFVAVALYVEFVDLPGLHRFLGDASAVNGRGDEVTAETERDGSAPSRAQTVIRLKPAHRWFATTLVEAQSDDYLVGFKWSGVDRLVVTLDFGCTPQMKAPVERVGPIEIVYRFDRNVILPAHGYSSFPRDAPREPCPVAQPG